LSLGRPNKSFHLSNAQPANLRKIVHHERRLKIRGEAGNMKIRTAVLIALDAAIVGYFLLEIVLSLLSQ
jgi:hypothetical protein